MILSPLLSLKVKLVAELNPYYSFDEIPTTKIQNATLATPTTLNRYNFTG